MSNAITNTLRPVCRHQQTFTLRPSTRQLTRTFSLLPSHQTQHRRNAYHPPRCLQTSFRLPHASFSTSARSSAAARTPVPKVKGASMPSMTGVMKRQQAEALVRGEVPDDLGLLPMTVVMPPRSSRPSLIGDFKERRRMEWKRFQIRLGEYLQMFMFKFFQVKPKPKLQLGYPYILPSPIPSIAADLYTQIYSSLASNNFTSVSDKVCAGFLSTLKSRAAKRPSDLRLHWVLHSFLSRPRLMSFKVGVLPTPPGVKANRREANGIIQAVVKIKTRQSLRHLKQIQVRDPKTGNITTRSVQVDGQGRAINEELPTKEKVPADAKDQVEYLVVQKILRKGKFGEWMAWGLTNETSYEEMLSRQKYLQDMIASQGRPK